MPIGIDGGTGRRFSGAPPGPLITRPPEPTRPPAPQPNPAPPPATPPPNEPTVRIETFPELEVVAWTVWRTAADERVCPVCGPLDGQEWPSDAGPMPPAHPNCRCERVFSRVEVRVRS